MIIQRLKEISCSGGAFDAREESFPSGAVIAICKRMAYHQVDDPLMLAGSREELALGDFTPGRWARKLGDIKRTKPMPARDAKCFGIGRGR